MELAARHGAQNDAACRERTGLRDLIEDLIRTFSTRGDLAHLALFLWASVATALALFALRELAAAMRRFDDFVRELSRFNRKLGGSDGHAAQRAPRHSR
jgi:hypothetical protein